MLQAGIYWRRESRQGKRDLEVPPKPVHRIFINCTLPTYNTLCYLFINITYTTLTAYITLRYITLHDITIHYITCLHTSLAIPDIT